MAVNDREPMVQGNRLTWTGPVGVYCTDCNGGKILLNTILGSPSDGLVAESSPSPSAAGPLQIQGNRITATAQVGVAVTTASGLAPGAGIRVTQNSVADTGFRSPAYDCFFAAGSGHVLTANSAKGCAGAGFHSAADDIELTGNQATGVGTNGFFVDGYNDGAATHFGATLVGNKTVSASGDGFALYDRNGGGDLPMGTTGNGNVGLLNRQDFCNEGAPVTLGSFAPTSSSTTCDIKR
jgi:hypothetical protein